MQRSSSRLPLPFRRPRPPEAGATPPPPSEPTPADPGLYAALGLSPRAADWEIQVAYRRLAAQLALGEEANPAALKQLNAAYEVLGNPGRRAEYDRWRAAADSPAAPGPTAPSRAATIPRDDDPAHHPRLRHPRRRRGGAGNNPAELLTLLTIVLGAAAAGLFFATSVRVDLSPVTDITDMVGLGSTRRRIPLEAETPVPRPSQAPAVAALASASPAAVARPSAQPTLAEQFRGSTVSVSDPRPRRNAPVSVELQLMRDGRPASGVDVWVTVQYRTVRERWPQVGTVRTDASGRATVTFNIGDATPGYEVTAQAVASVQGQELPWTATFTPQ